MAGAVALSQLRLLIKRWLKAALAVPGFALRSRQPNLRVLFYHRVNPFPFAELGAVSRELTVNPDVFEAQLRWLTDRNYRSVSVEEFSRMMMGSQAIDPKALLITFDDGYEDNLLWAAPLLRKYGFSAVIFVISDFLGRSTADVWPNSDPAMYGKFLDAKQIGELKRSGFEFGSHTVRHPLLTTLPPEQQLEELQASKRQIEEIVGAPVRCLAYPGGDFDSASQRCAGQVGYTFAFSTIPGVNQPGMPLTALRRTEISASDSLLVFRAKMAGALDWLSFKESRALRRWVGRLNDLLLPLAQGRRTRDG
jgi:peptidoglycan/xylan/chitin deacetylase (PgdA/CDA1 family)